MATSEPESDTLSGTKRNHADAHDPGHICQCQVIATGVWDRIGKLVQKKLHLKADTKSEQQWEMHFMLDLYSEELCCVHSKRLEDNGFQIDNTMKYTLTNLSDLAKVLDPMYVHKVAYFFAGPLKKLRSSDLRLMGLELGIDVVDASSADIKRPILVHKVHTMLVQNILANAQNAHRSVRGFMSVFISDAYPFTVQYDGTKCCVRFHTQAWYRASTEQSLSKMCCKYN